jgi:hypothetical protein
VTAVPLDLLANELLKLTQYPLGGLVTAIRSQGSRPLHIGEEDGYSAFR